MVVSPDGPPFGPIVNGTQIVFFEYRPNKGAALAFLAFFAAAVLGHLVYLFWLRAWHFIPLILGGIGELFGYYGRALAHDDPNTAGPFIIQNLLILGSTPLIAATVYMSLGRIIKSLDLRHHATISPKLTAVFYVVIDVGCFVTQVFGSVAPASGDPSGAELGRKLIIGGLLAQLAALTLFLLSTLLAQRWASKDAAGNLAKYGRIRWKKYFFVTYGVTLAMLVRSLVRGIEFIEGDGGYIVSHEIFVFVLDGVPMVSVLAIYLMVHPGKLVKEARYDDKLADDGEIMLQSRD